MAKGKKKGSKQLDSLSVQKVDNGYILYTTKINGGSKHKVFTNSSDVIAEVEEILSSCDDEYKQ